MLNGQVNLHDITNKQGNQNEMSNLDSNNIVEEAHNVNNPESTTLNTNQSNFLGKVRSFSHFRRG